MESAASTEAPADAAAVPTEAAAPAEQPAEPAPSVPAAAPVAVAPTTTVTPDSPPQEDAYNRVPFNIGLFPGLSINGTQRRKNTKPIVNTFSLSFGWSRAAVVDGFAGALGATVVDERAEGLVWSVGGNINHGEHKGVQTALGFNLAESVKGGQAAMFNRAKDVKGVQFGLVNASKKVRGVQVGLINVADEADASIGLLPITREGNVHPEFWTSDTAAFNVGLRLPAKYTYTFFNGGVHPFGRRVKDDQLQVGQNLSRGKALEAGMGFGGHIPVTDALFIDLDIGANVVTNGLTVRGPVAGLARMRIMLGWQVAKRFALYGGPTLNAMVDDPERPVDRPGYGWVSWSDTFEDDEGEDAVRVRVWPGFAAGVRF